MWEPSGNNSSPSVLGSSHIFPVRYRKKGIFLLDLLIYLIPPLVLLPFHARGVTSGFTPYFLGFTTLEFFGLLLIRFVRRNSSRKMIRGRTGATEIGLRFGLGLPLTVVFQVGGPSGFLAGFRLLPGILALFAGRGRSLVPVYIGLYAAGSIFFFVFARRRPTRRV